MRALLVFVSTVRYYRTLRQLFPDWTLAECWDRAAARHPRGVRL